MLQVINCFNYYSLKIHINVWPSHTNFSLSIIPILPWSLLSIPTLFWFCFVWLFWDRYWYYFFRSVSYTQNNNNVDWILYIYNIGAPNAIGEFWWTYFFLINLCYFFFLLYYITQSPRAVLGRSADEYLQLGCKLKGKEFTIPTVNVMWAESFDRYTLSDHESFLLILLSWFLRWISIENHLVFFFILLILVTSFYWCFNVKWIFAIVPAINQIDHDI